MGSADDTITLICIKKIRLKKSKPELCKCKLDNLETMLLVCKTFPWNLVEKGTQGSGGLSFWEQMSRHIVLGYC